MPRPHDAQPSDLEDLLPDLRLADVLRQRPQGIGSARHALRIAIAVTVSWMIAEAVSQSTFALFAPITTLLVVQSSPWTTLGVSVQRVLGTGIGVLVASVYVNLVGLNWWSFLIGVLVALLIARRLPWSLGGQLQIPVAVVFVLALGPGTMQQDAWRVLDVVIGGAVGLVAVFVYPPRPKPAAFEVAMRSFRDGIITTLRDVGLESAEPRRVLPADVLHAYVGPSRRLRSLADDARSALLSLVEGSQFNLRAGDVPADLEERAVRLRRLSGIGVQVRGIVGAANRAYDRAEPEPSLTGVEFGSLVVDVVDLLEAVLGTGDIPVGATDREASAGAEERLAQRLQAAARDVLAREQDAGDALTSVSLLGRLEHVRSQAADYPTSTADSTGQAPRGEA